MNGRILSLLCFRRIFFFANFSIWQFSGWRVIFYRLKTGFLFRWLQWGCWFFARKAVLLRLCQKKNKFSFWRQEIFLRSWSSCFTAIAIRFFLSIQPGTSTFSWKLTKCFFLFKYFRTFAVIAAKYFTVLLFYFPIFLAFAINFRVLLSLSEASFESRQFWNSSMISIFRTFTMLTDPDPGKTILERLNLF